MSARLAPPWPEDRHPNSSEWVDWFLANSREGQEEIAAMAVDNLADINNCLSSSACWINR